MQDYDVKPSWKALLPVCNASVKTSKQSRRRHNNLAENGAIEQTTNLDHRIVKEHLQPPKRSFNETIEKLLHRSQSAEPEMGPSSGKYLNIDSRQSPDSENDPSSSRLAAAIPKVAQLHHYNAPVHLDVGGKIYTTTLETLTKHNNSHIANLFTGQTPVVLDYLKQNYFIDRDGKVFRHVLNYLRTGQLLLPLDFQETSLLIQEAEFYGLDEMVTLIKEFAKAKKTAQ